MTEYNVNKALISKLKENILQKYDDQFSNASKKHGVTKKEYLLKVFPSLVYKKNRCCSRVWNSGFGLQCSRKPLSNGLCKIHYKEVLKKGFLKHGHILDDPPHMFNSKSI